MQALATFGNDIAIAFSGAEDVALIEYAHLTGRPYRVFRWAALQAPGVAMRLGCHAQHACAACTCAWGVLCTALPRSLHTLHARTVMVVCVKPGGGCSSWC